MRHHCASLWCEHEPGGFSFAVLHRWDSCCCCAALRCEHESGGFSLPCCTTGTAAAALPCAALVDVQLETAAARMLPLLRALDLPSSQLGPVCRSAHQEELPACAPLLTGSFCLCFHGALQVGVSAAARIKKSCLCLCTNGVSVDQWKYQFEMWTNIQASKAGAAAWIARGYCARCQRANLQSQQLATRPAAQLCAAGPFAAGWKQERVSAFALPSRLAACRRARSAASPARRASGLSRPPACASPPTPWWVPEGCATLLVCWHQCGIPAGSAPPPTPWWAGGCGRAALGAFGSLFCECWVQVGSASQLHNQPAAALALGGRPAAAGAAQRASWYCFQGCSLVSLPQVVFSSRCSAEGERTMPCCTTIYFG